MTSEELHNSVHAAITNNSDPERATDAVMWIVRAALADRDKEITWLSAHAADEMGAKQVAAEAADRFRDVMCEALGYGENPGDDAAISALRAHFGKTGPEPRRWRDFMVGANAQRDQINAERRGGPDVL